MLPPCQYTRGMTAAECAAVRRVLEYDEQRGAIVWARRTPDMFPRNKDPVRMCGGWNRRQAGQVAGVRAPDPMRPDWGIIDFQFMGERCAVHTNDVMRLLVGRGLVPPARTLALRKQNDADDDGLIRRLFKVRDGQIVWQRIEWPDFERCVALGRRVQRYGHRPAVAQRRTWSLYNATKAGKPAAADTTDRVVIVPGLTVTWGALCAALSVDLPVRYRGTAPLRDRRPAVPADVLRAAIERVAPFVYRWKPRNEMTWMMLAAHGVEEAVPDSAGIVIWNHENAGRNIGRGPAHAGKLLYIGRRRMLGSVLERALS